VPEQIEQIPVESIERDETQPREFFDPEKMAELKAGIEARGLLQPITVRPKPGHPGRYIVVMGERRWRAHVELGQPTISAMVRDEAKAPGELFIDQMVENVNRADMNPMEEAAGFQRILDEHPGWQAADVARATGKTTQLVNLRLPLNDLIGEFQQLVRTGAVKAGTGAQLGLLRPDQQRAALVKFGKGQFASDNELLHYAFSVKQQGEITMIVEVYDLEPEEREKRERDKRKALSVLQRLEVVSDDVRALKDPTQIAQALGPAIGSYIERIGAVQKALADAMFSLRQAKAVWTASGAELNPDALPDTAQLTSSSS
jgi:ParB family chromosome partitioning protein